MTRENKLALIVGFSLVLVVGVLISDHFSRARAEPIGNDLTPGTAQSFGAAGGGPSAPIGQTAPSQMPMVHATQPLAGLENNGSERDHIAAAGRQDDHAASAESAHPAPRQPVDIPMTQRGSVIPGSEKPEAGPGKKGKEKSAGGPEPVETGLAAANAKKYEVQPNDSWYRIAQTEYGDAGLWQKLQAFNKKEDIALRVGAVLLVPSKEVLTGKPADPADSGVRGSPKGAGKVAPEGSAITQGPGKAGPKGKDKDKAAVTPIYATYTVKRGDDLSKIAQSQLGSSRRYREIVDLNRDIIDDEESLRPGVTLKMPAK